MNELTVVLPAYNEGENIGNLIKKWTKEADSLKNDFGFLLKIVVVDDGSSDDTIFEVENLQKEYSNVNLVIHEQNQGLGAGVRTGIEYFLKERTNSPYLCIMDADNTQSPKYIHSMVNAIKQGEAHVVIASRYRKGSKVDGVSPFRLFMSSGARFVFTVLLHIPGVRDYTCGYRLYERELLKEASEKFKDKLVEENGFTCMVELLYKLHSVGAVVTEVPFHLRYDRKLGSSKMSVLKTALHSIRLSFELRKNEKFHA